jgi:hypothetical protein
MLRVTLQGRYLEARPYSCNRHVIEALRALTDLTGFVTRIDVERMEGDKWYCEICMAHQHDCCCPLLGAFNMSHRQVRALQIESAKPCRPRFFLRFILHRQVRVCDRCAKNINTARMLLNDTGIADRLHVLIN